MYSTGLCIYSLYISKNFSFLINSLNIENKILLKLYIYYFIIFILWIIFWVLNLSLICHFSPILYFITEIISPILVTIFQNFFFQKKNETIFFIILYIIGDVLQIIAILFYNEIIIINRCGLNENTTIYIKQRDIEEQIDWIDGV